MKRYRVDFSKGVNAIVDKAVMEDGLAAVLDNVDLRTGQPRPFAFPVYVETSSLNNARFIFEYNGEFYYSTEHRYYAASTVEGSNILYYCQ